MEMQIKGDNTEPEVITFWSRKVYNIVDIRTTYVDDILLAVIDIEMLVVFF